MNGSRVIAEKPSESRRPRFAAWIFRFVVALNFLRFALSFWPHFEGTAARPGLADSLFGIYRSDGFRLDFSWLILSTFAVFAAIFYFFGEAKHDRRAKIDALFCIAWVLAFVIYVGKALITGVLDFG